MTTIIGLRFQRVPGNTRDGEWKTHEAFLKIHGIFPRYKAIRWAQNKFKRVRRFDFFPVMNAESMEKMMLIEVGHE